MVKLAGLAIGVVSGELTLGRLLLSPALADNIVVPHWMRRSTVQNRVLLMLLLQVNVIFPLSGTTYPPGIGRASAESVTEEDSQASTQNANLKHLTHRSNQECKHKVKVNYK